MEIGGIWGKGFQHWHSSGTSFGLTAREIWGASVTHWPISHPAPASLYQWTWASMFFGLSPGLLFPTTVPVAFVFLSNATALGIWVNGYCTQLIALMGRRIRGWFLQAIKPELTRDFWTSSCSSAPKWLPYPIPWNRFTKPNIYPCVGMIEFC